jgi:hypothetical protein
VAQLAAGVTMATIYQRLRDERGLAASVASLRRYVAANLTEEARRAQVRVLRLDPPAPGQEAQVDYGQLGHWLDPSRSTATSPVISSPIGLLKTHARLEPARLGG